MKHIKIFFSIAVLLGGYLVYSCTEVDDVNLGDKGQVLIKLAAAVEDTTVMGKASVALDLVEGVTDVALLSVRREAPSESELKKSATVVVKFDQAVIDSFNAQNETEYVTLPDSTYTVDAANPLNGGEFSLTFAPGEFAKDIIVHITTTKIDLASQFALGFTVKSTTQGSVSKAFRKVMVEVGAKNKYDGLYEVTGTMVDHVNSALTGNYPVKFKLITSGPNQCIGEDQDYGGIYHSILNAGSLSGYGSFGLVFNFDPDGSGKIVSIVNYYGQPAGNTRSAKLDPSGENVWDPATKNMKVKYFMIQTNQATGTDPRTEFDETWTYKGSR